MTMKVIDMDKRRLLSFDRKKLGQQGHPYGVYLLYGTILDTTSHICRC